MVKQPQQIDKIIARNLKQARLSRSLSLQDVASNLNVTYQQIQKYENATNRISAGRLWDLAQIYRIPIQDLFTHHVPQNKTAD